MICAIAVDPSIFSNWSDYLSLRKEFGFSKARVIPRFPKKWQRLVYEASSKMSTMQQKSIESWLKNAECFLVKSNYPYNGGSDWLTNAECAIACENPPFNIIISSKNPNNNLKIIVTQNGVFHDNEELFNCPTGVFMNRNEDGYRNVCEPLIKYSENCLFIIDPYFNGEQRYLKTFKIIMKCVMNNKNICENIDKFQFKLFTMINNMQSDIHKVNLIKNQFRKYLMKNFQLEVVLLKYKPEKFHNRYILTDRCGVSFPRGLDIGKVGCVPDTINILDDKVYLAIFDYYKNLCDDDIEDKLLLAGVS